MRRRRKQKSELAISLFPFLAVLICTMGVLIVVLVVMMQQARVHSRQVVAEQEIDSLEQAAEQAKRAQQIEDIEWRRGILNSQRVQYVADLERKRAEAGYVDARVRDLKEQLLSLADQTEYFEQNETERNQKNAAVKESLFRIKQELIAKRNELASEQAAAKHEVGGYAIVMHDRLRNGTRRRPIYIECTDHGVIIQPEGIVLRPDDFADKLGPGNPLDAVLRTVRTYWSQYGGLQSGEEEPYPLLLVRPDGPVAYSKAREAMAVWDDRYGYELIDADVKLRYPPADPQLAAILRQSLADARRRHAVMIAQGGFGSERGSGSGRPSLRASPRGGFVPVGGSNQGQPGSGTGRSSDTFTGKANLPAVAPTGEPIASTPSASQFQGTSNGNAPNGQPQQPSNPAQNQPSNGIAAGASAGAPPISSTRGKNWALDGVSDRSNAITRPLTVFVANDRLVLVPERGLPLPQQATPINGNLSSAVSTMAENISAYTKRWGTAGIDSHWRPIVRVQVAPGAEGTFAEFERLLQGSGLIIERRN